LRYNEQGDLQMAKRTKMIARGRTAALGVVVLATLLVIGVSRLRRWHPFDQDYSELPPERAFALVFRQAVPPGVTDIQAAGPAWLGGRDIWMRFRASEAAVKLLTGGSRPVSTEKEPCIGTAPVHEADLRKMGWGDVDRIRHPLCYEIDPPWNLTGWIQLIYDRQRHLVFAHLYDI
jgi:hypothetical protein